MKCIINCKENPSAWLEAYFPDIYPYLVKLANKRLLEYYIDFCVLLGIRDICIVMDKPELSVEEYFQDGSRWGAAISYGLSRPDDGINNVIKKNRSFIGESPLLLIHGFIFINYSKNREEYPLFTGDENRVFKTESGALMFLPHPEKVENPEALKAEAYHDSGVGLESIQNMQDYFQLSMDILKNHSNDYILPGYNNEDGVFIGQNVEISKNTRIESPIIIGNNVQFKNLSAVGPGAVIGSNVLIDHATTVADSIIYDFSYIGSDLEISNKVIYKNNLIDPESGEILSISDDFLISEVETGVIHELCYRLFHCFVALLMLIVMLIPYVIGRILCMVLGGIRGEIREVYIDKKSLATWKYKHIDQDEISYPRKLFCKFSLHKFPLIFQAVRGKIFLAGNLMLPVTDRHKTIITEMGAYHPAVFSYSEMLGEEKADDFQVELNELYYSNNAGLFLDMRIIIKAMVKELFS